jgi:hypothetical protein
MAWWQRLRMEELRQQGEEAQEEDHEGVAAGAQLQRLERQQHHDQHDRRPAGPAGCGIRARSQPGRAAAAPRASLPGQGALCQASQARQPSSASSPAAAPERHVAACSSSTQPITSSRNSVSRVSRGRLARRSRSFSTVPAPPGSAAGARRPGRARSPVRAGAGRSPARASAASTQAHTRDRCSPRQAGAGQVQPQLVPPGWTKSRLTQCSWLLPASWATFFHATLFSGSPRRQAAQAVPFLGTASPARCAHAGQARGWQAAAGAGRARARIDQQLAAGRHQSRRGRCPAETPSGHDQRRQACRPRLGIRQPIAAWRCPGCPDRSSGRCQPARRRRQSAASEPDASACAARVAQRDVADAAWPAKTGAGGCSAGAGRAGCHVAHVHAHQGAAGQQEGQQVAQVELVVDAADQQHQQRQASISPARVGRM